MRFPERKSSIALVGFVIFLVVFSYALLTYTRRVESTSMLPTLEPGDLVVIVSVPISQIHLGDIVVYNPPCSNTGSSVIHRVVEIKSGALVTKGDNNPSDDVTLYIAKAPGVTQACLVGKVVFVAPYVELLASLPYGLNYALAGLILIAVVLYEVLSNAKPERVPAAGEGGSKSVQAPRV